MRLTEVIKELVKTLALVSDEIKRSVLLKSIARKFNIRENLLEAELDKLVAANVKTAEKKETAREEVKKEAPQQAPQKTKLAKHLEIIERDLIKLLFEGDKHILNFIFQHIHPEDIFAENDH